MVDRKYLPLITLAICAILALLYRQFIYLPVQSKILQMQMEIQQIEMSLAELDALQARYGDFEEFLALTDERLALAQEYLPSEMRDEEFTAELYRLADYRKILVNSVQVGDITGEELQRQSIKIRVETDYISLLNFIREVLDGGRMASLENYSINNDGKSNILDCELEFFIYAANIANP